MTTPTKEQICEIMSKMPSDYADFCAWGMSPEITEFIITEWEKIRNSHK